MRAKSLDRRRIKRALKTKCSCMNKCIDGISAKIVMSVRDRYWSKTRQCRAQWLTQTIRTSQKRGKFYYMTLDTGKQVCQKAFMNIMNVNKNSLTKCKRLSSDGAVASKGAGIRDFSSQRITTISWLEDYSSFYGDRMPDSVSVLLPYKTLKDSVYEYYKRDMSTEDHKSVSRTSFFRIWADHFAHLKIKQVSKHRMIMIVI